MHEPAECKSGAGGGTTRTHLDSDLVVREREELLAEPVPVLLLPLLGEELDDLLAPLHELPPVPPDRVGLPARGALAVLLLL